MNGAFVAAMEDVLYLYGEPYDPERPMVCFDETSASATGGLADVREPLPAQPGRPRRQDYEYRRAGIRNLFLLCEPLAGWRVRPLTNQAITERRTMQDFAHQMHWLVDVAYPHATVVRVVLDNLNTHRMASLYETFPAAEVRRIVKRLEFHHTPKHAQLAEYGGDRAQCVDPRLSQGQRPGRRCSGTCHHGLRQPEHRPRPCQLALQHRRRQDQTPPFLPLPFQP